MSELVVFGTGTFAELVDFYLTHDSDHEVVAFTADREYVDDETAYGRPLAPFDVVTDRYPPEEYAMFVAVGYRDVNRLRAEKFAAAKAKGYELVSYVCSESTHWGDTEVGENCFVFEDQTIQPFVELGDDVVLWSGNHVGHHATLGDHSFVTSHVVISGYVDVEPYAFLGVNATLRDEVTVGESCVVGAGATVVDDTEPESVYLGQPAERYDADSGEVGI
jgi:sugar O-acyltransferase (sialic acid O-acetyltransferase NeuD family)